MTTSKQMSLEMFSKRKPDIDVEQENIKELKKRKIEDTKTTTTPTKEEHNQQDDTSAIFETDIDEGETEEMVDQMIMDLATDDSEETTKLTPEQRKVKREADREAKRLKKLEEEERKKEAKRLKKIEEEERKRLKKEKDEEEKRLKREKIETERKLKQENKEREKLEKQKKKEEETAAKEEKKRLEKEGKERERERIERERELAKKAEEEKLKKRSIMNFFKVKTEDDSGVSAANSQMSDLKKVDTETDFNQYFLPFHVSQNITLATTKLDVSTKWDNLDSQSYTPTFPSQQSPIKPINRASEVLQCLNLGSINEANVKFQNVPLKYLKFYENKKPAYFGTFSYTYEDIEDNVPLATNPCEKIKLKSQSVIIDYDYYSDINEDEEEGEEGEGEDINSDDDEDDDDDEGGSSDIEEFLDENDSKNTTSSKVFGPLVAVVRHYEQTTTTADSNEFTDYFKTLQWETASENLTFSIDPFKNYWTTEIPKTIATLEQTTINLSTPVKQQTLPLGLMNPNSTNLPNDASTTTSPSPQLVVKRRTIPEGPERAALRSFIAQHSQLSLPTLCEVAVKGSGLGSANAGGLFSQWSKAVVKNTVKEEAVWAKKSGWVLRDEGSMVSTV